MKLILRLGLFLAALFAITCGGVEYEAGHLCHERIERYWAQVSCDSPCGACMQQCYRSWCPHNNTETGSGCNDETTRPDCAPLAD